MSEIPVGENYSIIIQATHGSSGASCLGVGVFDVTPGIASMVRLQPLCPETRKTGTAVVRTELNVCAGIDVIASSRTHVEVGETVDLRSIGRDEDRGPHRLSYAWSIASGPATLDLTDQTHAQLTCTGVGSTVVTLSVSDGDCGDSIELELQCLDEATIESLATNGSAEPR
jgi:hypothetical protein